MVGKALFVFLVLTSSSAFAQQANMTCYNATDGKWEPCSASNPVATNGTSTTAPTTGTGGQTSVTVTSTSGLVLAARTAPQHALSIKNESTTASIAVCFGAACTAALNTAGSITIAPGQLWSSSSSYTPLDAIDGVSSAATSPATIQAN